ncbi:hypothetical protein F8S13_11110 [Chloroflexia bacterium SDU3-3]|nr:hypothetical protein F8S13_11110 [Chloroflexia bacterium SDU3-3]
MSATMKSGLIFGLVGIVVTLAVSWIPVVGSLLCSPVSALLVGGVAGYFALKWATEQAGLGQGVLAGTVAGVGTLIGGAIFWIVAFGMVASMPEFSSIMEQEMSRQEMSGQVSPEQMQSIVGVMGPVMGLCFGVLNLLVSLLGGLFGAMIAGKKVVDTPTSYPPAPPTTPLV